MTDLIAQTAFLEGEISAFYEMLALIYFLIGSGVSLGIFIASNDLETFRKYPMPAKIGVAYILGVFWIITIPVQATSKLFED